MLSLDEATRQVLYLLTYIWHDSQGHSYRIVPGTQKSSLSVITFSSSETPYGRATRDLISKRCIGDGSWTVFWKGSPGFDLSVI